VLLKDLLPKVLDVVCRALYHFVHVLVALALQFFERLRHPRILGKRHTAQEYSHPAGEVLHKQSGLPVGQEPSIAVYEPAVTFDLSLLHR